MTPDAQGQALRARAEQLKDDFNRRGGKFAVWADVIRDLLASHAEEARQIEALKEEVVRLRLAEQLAIADAEKEVAYRKSLMGHQHIWEEFGWPRTDLLECRGCRATKSKETGVIWAK